MWQTIDSLGDMLTVFGIGIALVTLIQEMRLRNHSILNEKARAQLAQVKQRLRALAKRDPESETEGHSGSASGAILLSGEASGRSNATAFASVTMALDPSDPIEKQIEALDFNMTQMWTSMEAQQTVHREGDAKRAETNSARETERSEALRAQIDSLAVSIATEERKDAEIGERSNRREVWGLGIALVGTALSSIAQSLG